MSKKKKPSDYINNKRFSKAVCDYVEECNKAKAAGEEIPIVTNYIALGFDQIATGLSRKPNFAGYSYKDEMVMDAIENCLRAIKNYNIEAATRTGNPNAFAYFTQISYYAFLRRINKEKKQQEIKNEIFEHSYTEDLIEVPKHSDNIGKSISHSYISNLRNKMKEFDEVTDDEYVDQKDLLPRKRIRKSNDSDLLEFV
jgi:hypothetical protein